MPRLVIPKFRAWRWLFVPVVAMGIASCIEWDRSTEPPGPDIRVYIDGIQAADGTKGLLRSGELPASTGGSQLTATFPPIVLKGGSAEVTFTSPEPFSRLVVAVDGIGGYFDLALGAPTQSATVLIVYSRTAATPTFSIRYAGGEGDGLGTYTASTTAYLPNGTGDVQVNITWNTTADVDLYVVDPFGDELFYADRHSNSGGELDIDSNAGCASDGPRAENVFWPFGINPPRGEYVVRVNYWSECGESSTDYVVTIRVGKRDPIIYRGSFSGAGYGGFIGAGKRVTSFVF